MKQIFYNGQIVTMEQEGQAFSAMLIEDDKIAALGSDDEILAQKTDDALCTNLDGKTVLPGFVVYFVELGIMLKKLLFFFFFG